MPATHSTGGIRYRQLSGFTGVRTSGGNDTFQIKYIVIGASSALAAEAFLISNGLPASTVDFRVLGSATAVPAKLTQYGWTETLDESSFIFTCDYAVEYLDTDEWSLQISTGGGSIRVTSSFNTTAYAPTGLTAPNFQSAIDVQDGKPQGVDRVIPAVKLTITYRMVRPADPLAFTALSSSLVGTVSNAPLLGHDTGEMLYLGGDGNFGSKTDPELQFSWAASKNATLSIGSIASIAKPGHDYLWVIYQDETTGTGADRYVTTKPRAAYVERIYTQEDHSLLGLLLT